VEGGTEALDWQAATRMATPTIAHRDRLTSRPEVAVPSLRESPNQVSLRKDTGWPISPGVRPSRTP
jgi:hypothetical protein